MKALEADELTWLPCPFCGGKQISVTSRENYYECLEENGAACIGAYHVNRARGCDVTVWEQSDGIRNYSQKLRLLNFKWNRRAKVTAPETETEEGGVQS